MAAVNVDADGTNTNSSIATLNLPAGSNVLFAGLYWGAVQGTASARTTVRLKAPGAGYVGITAGVTDVIGSTYQSFADVTTLVQNAGNGAYTVGNIGQTAGAGNWSGWTLVVAYQKSGAQLRNLSVFDGLQAGNGTNTQFDIGISGFYTPPTGTVNSNIGFVLYDGDRGQNDDAGGAASLLFGKDTASLSAVFDAINPQADFWNSSISFQGANVTAGRTPSYVNLLGVDIDNVKPNVPLPNSATTAVARFRASANDVNYPGVITLATDVFEPEIVTSFTKTATNDNGATSFHPGDIVTYTISLTNRGNDNSNNTRITDPLPTGVTYVPGSLQVTSGANSGAMTDAAGDDQAEYSPGTRTVTFRVGTSADASTGGVIAPTVGTTVTFKVSIDPVANNTSLSNVANVNYVSNTSGIPGSGSTPPSSFTVTGNADLSVTKTGPATVAAGAPISYTVTVANAGPDAADGAVLADTLPPGITSVSINCTPSGGASCPATMTNSMAIPTLPSGGSVVFTYNGTAPSSATTLTNTATITAPSGVTDPSNANNSASATTSVQTADVAVTNIASAGPYYPNQTVSYTLTVTNNGAGTADAVSLSDTLPASMTFVSLTAPAGWSATTPSVGANGTVTATTASIAPGATATFTLVVQIPAGAANGSTFSDTATVSASSVDPVPANNSATANITITAGADVSINKTLVTTGTYYEGQPLAYTLVVSNAGPVTATNVQVTDTPTNLTITNVSGAGCSALPCTIASLAAGASATINVTATPVAGTFDNAASVSAAQPDPTPGNNSDTTGNGGTAMAAMDLAVTNVLTSTSPAATGSQVTYTITVTNNGPQSIPGASLTETMPPQLTGVTWTCASGCDVASGSGDINVGITVPVGGSITILVTGTAPSTTPSTIAAATATANPSSFAIDANAANNSAIAPAVPVIARPLGATDDTGSIAGAQGGAVITNVLANDGFNGGAATLGTVDLTVVTPATNPNVTLDVASGAVSVAARTPAGTYTITYSICERGNPTNCDTATVTVTVTAAVIAANDDTTPAIVGANGGVALPSVLANDMLGSAAPSITDVTLTQQMTSNPAVTLDVATGAINVAAGTPAGTYTLTYQACERINPTNCDTATVTVVVSAAAIDAVNDAATNVNGVAGNANVVNVLGNDTLNGAVATLSNATLAQVSTTNPNVTLNVSMGAIAVAAGTPAGTYAVTYRLCEQLNPGNCDTATATVDVVAPALAAANDTGTTTQNTAIALTVLANDTMAGSTATSTAVSVAIATAPQHGTATVGTNGVVTYTPATNYSGTDTFTYRICDVVNPTVCATATANLVVTPNAVDAIDQTVSTPQTGPIVIDPMRTTTNGGGAPLDPSSVQIVTPPSTGTVVVNPNGTITFTPDRLFFGTVSFRYRICDRSTPTPVCDVATVTANVAMQAPQLRLVKTVPTRSVHVGDLVRYTVVVENTGISPANNATVVDTPPAGFTYVEGSLSVDDADDRFVLVGTQPIRINGIDVPVGGRATVVYVLRVGAGVGRGTHTNSVSATDATGSTVSNTATADVTIEGDPTVDDALILGTVFADTNGDGVQQDGEAGLPGVRIASVEGLVIETDVHGRFHLAGVQPQNALRGSNFVLKVDAATLPPGSTFTTANPLVRRITPGLPVRFDFGVSLPAGTDAGTTR